MGNKKVILGALALMLIIAVALVAILYEMSQTQLVWSYACDIQEGHQITQECLAQTKIPSTTDVDVVPVSQGIVGAYLKRDVLAGTLVSPNELAAENPGIYRAKATNDPMPVGQFLVPVSIPDWILESGYAKPGDYLTYWVYIPRRVRIGENGTLQVLDGPGLYAIFDKVKIEGTNGKDTVLVYMTPEQESQYKLATSIIQNADTAQAAVSGGDLLGSLSFTEILAGSPEEVWMITQAINPEVPPLTFISSAFNPDTLRMTIEDNEVVPNAAMPSQQGSQPEAAPNTSTPAPQPTSQPASPPTSQPTSQPTQQTP